MKLNYIDQINMFWKLDAEHSFNGNESRLYFYLLNLSNSLFWKNPVTNADGYTASHVGISVNTLKGVRNRLQQSGLLTFKPGGNGSRNKCIYYIVPADEAVQNNFNKVSNSDTLLKRSLTPYSIPGLQKTDDISKLKPKPEENTVGRANEDLPLAPEIVLTKKEIRKKKIEAFTAPSLPDCQSFFLDECKTFWTVQVAQDEAGGFFNHYEANGWVQSKGKPIIKWQSAAQGWIRRARAGEFKSSKALPVQECDATRPDEMLMAEIEVFYSSFLKTDYRSIRLLPVHYDLLKKQELTKLPPTTVEAIKARALSQRMEMLGGNNHSDLQLLDAYQKGQPCDLIEKDKPQLTWIMRRLAVMELFVIKQKTYSKTFFTKEPV